MDSTIIVAIIAFAGTAIGSVAGVLASNKLTLYRISQLEEKVNKHNNLIDRTYKLEERCSLIEENIELRTEENIELRTIEQL